MFLDAELKQVAEAKARIAVQADIRRQVVVLELLALRSRARKSFSGLALGLNFAGKVLDYLQARRKR